MPRRTQAPNPSYPVEVVIEGKTYRGSYTVTGGRQPLITVTSLAPWGTKTTQVGGMRAEDLARLLMREAVGEGLLREKQVKR